MSTNNNSSSPSWLDHEIYPFESHYLDVPGGKLHYIDEGEGDVLLFVHGTPTWSFLFKDQIKELRKNYRCIALDHLGFGLSDKPTDFPGTPQAHSKNLELLAEHIGLENVTLVVHDFGGPIGLGWALRNPEKIKRLVIFNTWLWETVSNPGAQKIDRILNSWLGKFMYLRLNFSPKVLLKQGFADKKKLERKVHRHFVRPFPNASSRMGLLRIGKSLLGSSDWYQTQWEQLERLEKLPKLLLWGMEDSFIQPEFLERWKERFPGVKVVPFKSGHFPMLEFPDGVSKQIRQFMTES